MPNYYVTKNMFDQTAVVRVDDDGITWWLGDRDQDAGYLAWLAEGNTAEEWKPEESAPTDKA